MPTAPQLHVHHSPDSGNSERSVPSNGRFSRTLIKDLHGTVIQFNTGKQITKKDLHTLALSIEYTYGMASKILPIFLQQEARAPWRALKHRPYIPPNLDITVCRCELDVATGKFHIADLRKGARQTLSRNSRGRAVKKSSMLYKDIQFILEDCFNDFAFTGLQNAEATASQKPFFELDCFDFNPGPGASLAQRKKVRKRFHFLVSNYDKRSFSKTQKNQCRLAYVQGLKVVFPIGNAQAERREDGG